MNASSDFFAELFETDPLKVLSISISLLLNIVLILGFSSIIWYDIKNPDSRTILSLLFSSVSFVSLEYFLVGQLLDTSRFLFGPMPFQLCLLHSIFKNVLSSQVFLLYNAISVFRYILVFWIKNPMLFKDFFWTVFVNIWIVIFSIVCQLIQHILPKSYPFYIYLCLGENPGSDKSSPNHISMTVVLMGLIFQGLITIRISIFKMKDSRMSENPSLFDFTANALVTLVFIIPGIFQFIMIKSSPQALNKFPLKLVVYGMHILTPTLIGMVTLYMFFKLHKDVGNAVKRKFFNLT